MTATATKTAVITPLEFGRLHPVKPVFPVKPVSAFDTKTAQRDEEIAKCRANHPAGKLLTAGV